MEARRAMSSHRRFQWWQISGCLLTLTMRRSRQWWLDGAKKPAMLITNGIWRIRIFLLQILTIRIFIGLHLSRHLQICKKLGIFHHSRLMKNLLFTSQRLGLQSASISRRNRQSISATGRNPCDRILTDDQHSSTSSWSRWVFAGWYLSQWYWNLQENYRASC